MQTLNTADLREEREALTNHLAALDKLLDAVDPFDGAGARNLDARWEKAACLPQDERQ
jgi:hypothetical protein